MIRVRGLITSIKSNLLTSRNAFPHKLQESWEHEFSEKNPKMNYLGKLLQTNEIRPYFIEKDIKELEKQDIYFFMYNKQLFHSLPREKKQSLIKNPNANCILKFHLAMELNTLMITQVQKHLLESFNSSVKDMSSADALFCLQLICSFKDVKEEINYYEVERKFLKEENPEMFLKSVYLLSELEFSLEMMTNELIQEKISMVENFSIETILQVKYFSKFYQLELTAFIENRLRLSFNEKRKNFKPQEAQFIVDLLQFYPESANLINIQNLTAQSYISYLDFFIQDEEATLKEIVPKPIQHVVPFAILSNAEMSEIYKIIKRRVRLELDTTEGIINNLKGYFTPNLKPVVAIIKYLHQEDRMTPENELLLEKMIINKIIKIGVKVFEEFNIVHVFNVLRYMSGHEYGTMNFWKRALKFVTSAIEDPELYKNLSGVQQKRFVVYMFQIFKNKPFPRQLEDQIINLTLLSLTINTWTLKQIQPLTKCLSTNMIADNELWFGIQQRIIKVDMRHLDGSEQRKNLKKIVSSFNHVNKGSYEFWSSVNYILSKKDKMEILGSLKIPTTLAHTYLKV